MKPSADLITEYFAYRVAREHYVGDRSYEALHKSIWHFNTKKLCVIWREGRVHEVCNAAFEGPALSAADFLLEDPVAKPLT